MREIGSEFWDVPIMDYQNDLFPKSTQWFLSGRSALQAIIRDLEGSKSVALPSWCCDSIIKPFVDANFEIHFYPVFMMNGRLTQEVVFDCDVLLLMDFFGYTNTIPNNSGFKGVIIRDVTHSLFSTKYSDADYYFGSLRKWCGVWTGGFAWVEDGHKLQIEQNYGNRYVSLRERAMSNKAEYMCGLRKDKCYLKTFDEAEVQLEKVGALPSEKRDIQIARTLDVEKIRDRRRANAEVLRSAFSDWLIFPELGPSDIPMFVPVLVPERKRDAMRRYLINNQIYCPVHWPVCEYHKLDEKTALFYENELSLVCDQRYTEEDMIRIIETINRFLEK